MADEMLKVTHIPKTVDDIRVGDIFHSHWGATMSLNTFWKVVKRTAKMVTLRSLRTIEVGHGFLNGEEYPVDEFEDWSCCYDRYRFVDKDGKVYQQVIRKLPESGTTITIHTWMHAWPWNGKPASFDHCD
jgi:hypothetical protein